MKNQDNNVKHERDLETLRQFAEQHPSDIIQLIDAIPIGICITNKQGHFVNVNLAYCDFYGYSPEELIGNSFLKVIPEDFQHEMKHLHNQFMRKRHELLGKWEVVDKSGATRKILSSAAYLPATKMGGPFKMTFITEEDESQQALNNLEITIQLLQRKISAQEMAQQLSDHDLRNNLSSILQIVDVLLDKQPTEEQKVWLNHLKQRSGDTLGMLKATSDYAKMEQGEYEPEKTEFDLVKVIREELYGLKKVILYKQLQVLLSYQSKPCNEETQVKVLADKFYMKRLLHNLLLNAVEASPESQEIVISLEHNRFFKIVIHNQGAVPQDIQSNFFDKFATSGKKKGTGLGTYIAKLVVEIHQGTIAYQSSEQEGTDIIILLPQSVLLHS
ncbi:sensor histidine kinase [Tunicatimonas pelagia]|uniref:sensor histidine kinase n=1 Tax=Tunicatimonas pelagia TaxID=931531 RepID=UPI002665FD2A|nr:PAS domain-containing sensor histidine kinase [Tunicatimonas pelagia]WKN43763.1 PAS domain-containing sensor histidine kinase [Tunicatimonas pelagia]